MELIDNFQTNLNFEIFESLIAQFLLFSLTVIKLCFVINNYEIFGLYNNKSNPILPLKLILKFPLKKKFNRKKNIFYREKKFL